MLLLLLCHACGIGVQAREDESHKDREALVFTGRMVHLDFEGGFWGIIADDGQRYDPMGVAPAFQVVGLRVRVKAKLAQGMVGFHQWGRIIEITDIESMNE